MQENKIHTIQTGTDEPEPAAEGINDRGNTNTHDKSQNAKQSPKGVYSHKFAKPFEFEGQKYLTMDFHFGSLTGHDMIKVEQELQDEEIFVMASEVSKTFQCKLAARAAKIGSDVIMAMPIHDFNKITNEARNFLLSSG